MGELVSQIHQLDLKAGWYLNGCKCGEYVAKEKDYEGDVNNMHAFGFEGVKIDGCGAQRNQTLYALLMKQSGRNYTIENWWEGGYFLHSSLMPVPLLLLVCLYYPFV